MSRGKDSKIGNFRGGFVVMKLRMRSLKKINPHELAKSLCGLLI